MSQRTSSSGKPRGKQAMVAAGHSAEKRSRSRTARALQHATPPIPVAAIVPCDGAYDLSGVMLTQMLTGTNVKVPSCLLYTVSGYHTVYGDAVNYGNLLQPAFANLLTGGGGGGRAAAGAWPDWREW